MQICSGRNITPHSGRGTNVIGKTEALPISGAMTNGSHPLLLPQLGGEVNSIKQKRSLRPGVLLHDCAHP